MLTWQRSSLSCRQVMTSQRARRLLRVIRNLRVRVRTCTILANFALTWLLSSLTVSTVTALPMLTWTLTRKVRYTVQSRYRYRLNFPTFWRSSQRLPLERNQPISFSGQRRKWRVGISWSNVLSCNTTCAFRRYFQALARGEVPPVKDRLEHPLASTEERLGGITKGALAVLHKQVSPPPPQTHIHTHTYSLSSTYTSITSHTFYSTTNTHNTHTHTHLHTHNTHTHTHTCTRTRTHMHSLDQRKPWQLTC